MDREEWPGGGSRCHYFEVTVGGLTRGDPLSAGTSGPAGIEEGEQERLCLLVRRRDAAAQAGHLHVDGRACPAARRRDEVGREPCGEVSQQPALVFPQAGNLADPLRKSRTSGFQGRLQVRV